MADRSPYDSSALDPLMAAQAANAFLAHSQAFIESLPTDPSQTEATASLGDIVASATCLSLSVELFLKSLLIVTGCPVRPTHDLLALYDALSPAAQAAVQDEYEALAADPGEGAVTLRLVYSHTPTAPPQESVTGDGARDASIRAVLERNRDAFSSWRYLHEIALRGEIVIVDYEYFHLTALASAVSNCCHRTIFGPGERRPPIPPVATIDPPR